MKIYEDSSKTELVTEISGEGILSLLDWERAEYSKERFLLSIPIRLDGSNGMFDILVAASAGFGTDFDNICSDQIELCMEMDKAECFLYVDDGVENDVWGCVELGNEEFFAIINRGYELMKGRDKA